MAGSTPRRRLIAAASSAVPSPRLSPSQATTTPSIDCFFAGKTTGQPRRGSLPCIVRRDGLLPTTPTPHFERCVGITDHHVPSVVLHPGRCNRAQALACKDRCCGAYSQVSTALEQPPIVQSRQVLQLACLPTQTVRWPACHASRALRHLFKGGRDAVRSTTRPLAGALPITSVQRRMDDLACLSG